MHSIKNMKYPHILLYSTVISLVTASYAYGIESQVTPGPSVGHRPVITGLILGTGNGVGGGNITLNTTNLRVGEAVGLLSAAGGPSSMDADGDLDKAGAHCVWYRVDPNTNAETVIKDPGPTDRNCHYVIQASDVGFKIKNTITIFSDQDIATKKGYTLNPIASLPVDTVSANIASSSLPFEIIYGPDTYVEIQPNQYDTHLPLISLPRTTLTPTDFVRMPGGNYRISFATKSSEEEVRIDILTLGRCLRNSGYNVYSQSVIGDFDWAGGNQQYQPILGIEFSAVAASVDTGNIHPYFFSEMMEFPGNYTKRFPMFPNDSTDPADPSCSGVTSHLNTNMRVSTTLKGYIDTPLSPTPPLLPGTEYNVTSRGFLLDTLDGAPSEIEVRVRLRAL